MPPTQLTTPAPDHALPSSSAASGRRSRGEPLSVLFEHLGNHPRVDAAVLVGMASERRPSEAPRGCAASPRLRDALEAALDGVEGRSEIVRAALERERPLFLPRVEAWEAAPGLHDQIERGLEPLAAERAWEALAGASLIGCPVRTSLGLVLGVLVVASGDPAHPLLRSDLQTVEVLADLAALALERSQLLTAESARARQELLLKRAAESTAGSLEIPEVEQRIADHALLLVGADHACVSRVSPGAAPIAAATAGSPAPTGESVCPAALADVVHTRSAVRRGGGSPSVHLPVALGARLFAVLSVLRSEGPELTESELVLLETLAKISAAAMANAVDFQRERRIAQALTRGFVPPTPLDLPGYEVGLLYEPAERQPVGGDVFGTWALPSGEVGVVVGDVAGKGMETAALSAMARFFIEARSWDGAGPAEVLAQAGRMLHSRLPRDTFVTAVFGLFCEDRIRYANAGQVPALVLRCDGRLEEIPGRGLPLGIYEDATYEEHELALDPGDLVVGFTDGLVEARRDGELFGVERLGRAVVDAAARAGAPSELVRLVHEEVRAWGGGLSDDAVALALKRQG